MTGEDGDAEGRDHDGAAQAAGAGPGYVRPMPLVRILAEVDAPLLTRPF